MIVIFTTLLGCIGGTLVSFKHFEKKNEDKNKLLVMFLVLIVFPAVSAVGLLLGGLIGKSNY